jgi:hypothetical protein
MHTINVNTNVNTATRESDEQFKTDKYLRYAVTDGDERLDFIPALFFTPSADNMAASWLRQHSDYDGGFWSYWIIPQGVGGNITRTAFSSSPRRPGILRRKENSLTGCASPAIILTVTSAPMQQELLPR